VREFIDAHGGLIDLLNLPEKGMRLGGWNKATFRTLEEAETQ
jgi:hypothetical protein